MKRWERAIGALAFLSIVLFNVWYIGHSIRGSERRQCEIINAEVAVMQENPPSTPTGIARQRVYEKMKIDRGC